MEAIGMPKTTAMQDGAVLSRDSGSHLRASRQSDSLASPTLSPQDVSEDRDGPASLGRNITGLPPTPPTLTNSDLAAPRKESLASNQEFAEAVRTALRAKASGTVTPTNAHHPPQTPDPSPPAHRSESPSTTATLAARSSHSLRPSPPMFAYASSRTESFHTAHENPDASQASMSRNLSPLSEAPQDMTWPDHSVVLPALSIATQFPPEAWNGSPSLTDPAIEPQDREASDTPPALPEQHRPLSLAALEFSDDNLEAELRRLKLVSNSHLRRRTLHHSLPSPPEGAPRPIHGPGQPAKVVITTANHEVTGSSEPQSPEKDAKSPGVSEGQPKSPSVEALEDAVVEPEVPSPHDSPGPPTYSPVNKPVAAADVSPKHIPEPEALPPTEDLTASTIPDTHTENANNMVYQEIREENVKRHSAILSGGALRVNIILPKPSPERKLKRTVKHGALRAVSSPVGDGHDRHPETEHRLRHKRAMSLQSSDASPELGAIREDNAARAVSGSAKSSPVAQRRSHDGSAAAPESLHVAKRRTVSSAQHEAPASPPQSTHTLRRFSRESQLENNIHVRRTSLASRGSEVSAAKSLDARFLHTTMTPLSASQMSDRTDVELCQAQGVSIFSHNNNSVLVLEHGSLPTSRGNTSSHSSDLHFPVPLPPHNVDFRFQPASPTSPSNPTGEKHSPLTNPRKPPEPPAFRVIPPTPNELERQLAAAEAAETSRTNEPRPSGPQRSLSLKQRARRYSESYILPLFARNLSLRRPHTSSSAHAERPTHLSPLWRPRYFWEEWDSEDDEDDYDYDDGDGEDGLDVLPPGGDTSEPQEPPASAAKFLPRNMSVRMPGFRGTGGFLVGNSLGLERHGTNVRRHHVSTRPGLQGRAETRQAPWESRKRHGSGSLTPIRLREKFSQIKADRAERALERRRDRLRIQIQHTR